MAYNNFTLELELDRFNLRPIDLNFCESLPTVEPQIEFLTIFNQSFPLAQKARSEKAKSELLVSPILVQARKLTDERVQLFSGEEFNVDQERGLNGFCDFLISKSDNPFTIDAPVLMLSCRALCRREPPAHAPLVEAKRGEIETGLGQCVAEMVAAQVYNQSRQKDTPIIYGCVLKG